MLSETLQEGLNAYRIGQKIRTLRQAKDMGLAQLGDHAGLSAGMLSRLERGQIVPTLPTLMRIALVFGVGLDHFFLPGEDRPVLEIVRRQDRLRMPDDPNRTPSYYFESLDFPVTDRSSEAFFADFPECRAASEPHMHAGDELVYVISGGLNIEIHGETHALYAGDSIYFDARFEHSYKSRGQGPCTAIVVVQGKT